MKKRVYKQLVLVAIISITLMTLMSMLIFYQVYKRQVFHDLKTYSLLIEETNYFVQENEFIDEAKETIRITYIDSDGTVLYDSWSDASSMDNHYDRPEVKEAREQGSGKIIRQSDTIGKNIYYYAYQLKDGSIIRVAKEASSIYSILGGTVPGLIIVAVLIFIVCLALAHHYTNQTMKPITEMANHMADIEDYVAFDELIPFARKIKQQHDEIQESVRTLRQENNKIQMITDHMEEGLLLVDAAKNIVIANPSSLQLLGANQKTYEGKNLLYISRNITLNECIDVALNGQKYTVTFEIDGKVLQAYANPVLEENQIIGVICFVINVTDEKANEKMRQEFSANVSHELKTPLTAISGYAELIEYGIAKDADILHFAKEIHTGAERLLNVINDIIKLSELDEMEGDLELLEVHLDQVIENCMRNLELKAKKLKVSLEQDCVAATIMGDPLMIEQLVYNLCDNAIRYNRENGNVSIRVVENETQVILEVKDTGIGIPKKYQERVFERFFRVDKSRSKATGGTGLGLAIVKHIILQHRANLELISDENSGTTIRVLFTKFL